MPTSPPPQPQSDGQVEGYERVVNGKVVRVNGYAKKDTTTTRALAAARKLPGRPQMPGQPGSNSTGRDIPGVKARPLPPEPPKVPPFKKEAPSAKRKPSQG